MVKFGCCLHRRGAGGGVLNGRRPALSSLPAFVVVFVDDLRGVGSRGVGRGDFLDVRVRFRALLDAEGLVEGAPQLHTGGQRERFRMEPTIRKIAIFVMLKIQK